MFCCSVGLVIALHRFVHCKQEENSNLYTSWNSSFAGSKNILANINALLSVFHVCGSLLCQRQWIGKNGSFIRNWCHSNYWVFWLKLEYFYLILIRLRHRHQNEKNKTNKFVNSKALCVWHSNEKLKISSATDIFIITF